MNAESKKSSKAPTQVPEGGNIENIRDILFGSQMRQYERRFQRLTRQEIAVASGVEDEAREHRQAGTERRRGGRLCLQRRAHGLDHEQVAARRREVRGVRRVLELAAND